MTTTRKKLPILLLTLVLLMTACNLQQQSPAFQVTLTSAATGTSAAPTETIPPYTPLATLTPSPTLRPPPTFEPPTMTLPPTTVPSATASATLDLSVSIPGLHGAETATPTGTPGCTPRKDWKLRYTVQRDDALIKIADKYGSSVQELAAGNCITDVNAIVIGQELRVPGTSQPVEPYVCDAWEVLTPLDKTQAIAGTGTITFNWRGPRAAHNLIRVIRPDGSIFESVVDLRQNQEIDLVNNLPQNGVFTWYVFPLDSNYQQIPCHEGGPWTFAKALSPTITPTIGAR
jgi:LysM repeat protein